MYHWTALHLATLPECHPLSKHLKYIAHHYNIQYHHSSIHKLLATLKTFQATIETLDPIHRSNVQEPIDYNIHIAAKKDQAIKEQCKLKEKIQVFTDGSSHDGRVGASAVLTWEGKPPCMLQYYLGTNKTHTVYSGSKSCLHVLTIFTIYDIVWEWANTSKTCLYHIVVWLQGFHLSPTPCESAEIWWRYKAYKMMTHVDSFLSIY
jgi:hypothetical protein